MLPLPPNLSINQKLRTENDCSLLKLEIVLWWKYWATIQQYILLFSAYKVFFAQEQNILKSVAIFLPLKH